MTPQEKGDALEHAVRRIEEVMLNTDPGLRGANAAVERNVRIVKDGISHEIDILVRVNVGTPYETVHFLECKNWAKPVGTDEIFKLQGKRDLLGAASAAVIARQFTKDAKALAEQKRVKLHLFTDDFWSPLDSILGIATTHAIERARISVTYRGQADGATPDLKLESVCQSRGTSNLLDDYVQPLIDAYVSQLQKNDPRTRLEGHHSCRKLFGYDYSKGELLIDGREVSELFIDLEYTLLVYKSRIVAKFHVDGRGGFAELEFPEGACDVKKLTLELVSAASKE
jgi:hypothetical protein